MADSVVSSSSLDPHHVILKLPPRAHLRPAEIAEFLQIGTTKMYRLISEGEIPHVKFQKTVRIPRDAFIRWYEEHYSSV